MSGFMNVTPQAGDVVEVVEGHRLGGAFVGGKRGEVVSTWTTDEGVPYVTFLYHPEFAMSVPANAVFVVSRAAA